MEVTATSHRARVPGARGAPVFAEHDHKQPSPCTHVTSPQGGGDTAGSSPDAALGPERWPPGGTSPTPGTHSGSRSRQRRRGQLGSGSPHTARRPARGDLTAGGGGGPHGQAETQHKTSRPGLVHGHGLHLGLCVKGQRPRGQSSSLGGSRPQPSRRRGADPTRQARARLRRTLSACPRLGPSGGQHG